MGGTKCFGIFNSEKISLSSNRYWVMSTSGTFRIAGSLDMALIENYSNDFR